MITNISINDLLGIEMTKKYFCKLYYGNIKMPFVKHNRCAIKYDPTPICMTRCRVEARLATMLRYNQSVLP